MENTSQMPEESDLDRDLALLAALSNNLHLFGGRIPSHAVIARLLAFRLIRDWPTLLLAGERDVGTRTMPTGLPPNAEAILWRMAGSNASTEAWVTAADNERIGPPVSMISRIPMIPLVAERGGVGAGTLWHYREESGAWLPVATNQGADMGAESLFASEIREFCSTIYVQIRNADAPFALSATEGDVREIGRSLYSFMVALGKIVEPDETIAYVGGGMTPAWFPKSDPTALWPVGNGVLDLNTGTITPYRREMFVRTRYKGKVLFGTGAKPPRRPPCLDPLMTSFPDEPAAHLDAFGEWLGLALSNDRRSRRTNLILMGRPGAGKGMLIDFARRMAEQGTAASPTVMTELNMRRTVSESLARDAAMASASTSHILYDPEFTFPVGAKGAEFTTVMKLLGDVTSVSSVRRAREITTREVKLKARMVLATNHDARWVDGEHSDGAIMERFIVLPMPHGGNYRRAHGMAADDPAVSRAIATCDQDEAMTWLAACAMRAYTRGSAIAETAAMLMARDVATRESRAVPELLTRLIMPKQGSRITVEELRVAMLFLADTTDLFADGMAKVASLSVLQNRVIAAGLEALAWSGKAQPQPIRRVGVRIVPHTVNGVEAQPEDVKAYVIEGFAFQRGAALPDADDAIDIYRRVRAMPRGSELESRLRYSGGRGIPVDQMVAFAARIRGEQRGTK